MAKREKPTLADIQKKLDAEKLENAEPIFNEISKDRITVTFSSEAFKILKNAELAQEKRIICARFMRIHLTWREVEYRVKNKQCVRWIDNEDVSTIWLFFIRNVDIDSNSLMLEAFGFAK